MGLKTQIAMYSGFALVFLGLIGVTISYAYQYDYALGIVLVVLGIAVSVIGALMRSKLKRRKP